MNIAARAMGSVTDLYRARGAHEPLNPANRIMRMHAAFTPRRGGVLASNPYGDPLWRGIFDAAYTRVGDYLVQPDRTLFIASQLGLAQPLCVQTNRFISISRTVLPGIFGVNAYGRTSEASKSSLMTSWPASVLGVNNAGNPATRLPDDLSVPHWMVLVPAYDNISVQAGDLYSDDLGRSAVVSAAELTGMGWRLTVKQATT